MSQTAVVQKRRHLLKALSYRLVGTAHTFALSYFIFGSVELGAVFSGVELVTKTVLYYLHERIWYTHTAFGVVTSEINSDKRR